MTEEVQKKRKLSENEEEEETTGKEGQKKVQGNTISVEELREQIKASNILAVKEYFSFNEENEEVRDYLNGGGSTKELATLLTSIDLKKNMNLTVAVFSALQYVIVRTVSEYPLQYKELVDTCKDIVSQYFGTIQSMLPSNNSPKIRKTALKLLTALVIVNESLASDILSNLEVTRELTDSLAHHHKANEPDSIRVAFINFLMAFIIDRSTCLIQKLIFKKGLLTSIFPGLKSDIGVVVELVLSAFLKCIVENKEIYKTQKLSVFNTHSLQNLACLYSWNPNYIEISGKHAKPQPGTVKEPDPEERENIREIVHNLLMLLCTSTKLGVIFPDPSYGTSGGIHNNLVFTFIQGIGQPWEDPLKEELVIQILLCCPDIIKFVFPLIQQLLENPQKAVKAITFFSKVIKQVKVDPSHLEEKECMKLAQNIFAHSTFLKFVSKRDFFVHPQQEIRLTVTKGLVTLLEKLFEFSKSVDASLKRKNAFHSAMNDFLCSNLANGTMLFESLKMWKEEGNQKGILKSVSALLLYDRQCPHLLDNLRYNTGTRDIINSIVKDNISLVEADGNQISEAIVITGIHLSLILFPQDPSQDEFFVHLNNLCKMLVRSTKTLKLGLEVLRGLMEETGYFLSCPHELKLWIYALEERKEASQLICEGIVYTANHMSQLYRTVLRAEEATTPHDDTPSQTLNLDDFLNLSPEDGEASVDSAMFLGLNVSPFLPAILKSLSNESEHQKARDEYVVTVLVHLFHYQVSTQAFVSLLKEFNCNAVNTVLPYMESWKHSASVLNVPPFLQSVHNEISEYMLTEGFSHDPMDKVDQNDAISGELCFRHCMFILCQLSSGSMATQSLISRAVPLLNSLVQAYPSAHSILAHPQLLRDFHPIRKSKHSNLTNIVLCITKCSKVNSRLLVPFSNRLAFELRYALRKKLELKLDSLPSLMKVIPLSEADIKDLLLKVIELDSSHFMKDETFNTWALVEILLLKKAIENEIFLSNDELSMLCNQLIEFCEKGLDVENLCGTVYKFLKSYPFPDFYGDLSNKFRDLLQSLCRSTYWNADLCKYLLQEVSFIGDLCNELPLSRAVPLLASIPDDKCVSIPDILVMNSNQIITALTTDPVSSWIIDLSTLVEPHLSVEICETMARKLKKHEHDIVITKDSLNLLLLIFKKASLDILLSNLIQVWLCRAVKSNETQKSQELCRCLIKCTQDPSVFSCPEKCSAELSKMLISRALREEVPCFLEVLQQYVKLNATELSAEMLFDLTTGHSCFLNIILENKDIKYELVRLLHELVKKDKSIAKTKHLPILLAAYSASLSKTDQTILMIFHLYESFGLHISSWKPCMWGTPAIDFYSVRKKPVLIGGTSTQTLNLLDLNVVHRTISNFPIHRSLLNEELVDVKDDIYDPAFLLPVLSQALAPGSNVVGTRMVAQSGALSLAIAALASSNLEMRSAAYHIIFRHYSSLTDTKDNLLWTHFIDAIRNGISEISKEKMTRLSSIAATFLSRAALIISDPTHIMFNSIINFTLAKPSFNLKTVPALLELLNSTEQENKAQKEWILEVIRDGLRETSDLQMALNCFVFKFILDFHSCFIASKNTKALIEDIVEKCITSTDVKKQLLINEYSILPWISHGVKSTRIIEKILLKVSSPYKPLVGHIKRKIERLSDGVNSLSVKT